MVPGGTLPNHYYNWSVFGAMWRKAVLVVEVFLFVYFYECGRSAACK